ncbi:Uncharacterised protein [Legionella maceachernii]|nr:Uncharacterised protein [Legionella maceachernii]
MITLCFINATQAAKSREVLRVAQDDSCVVVPNVVRDLLVGVTAKNWEALRVACPLTLNLFAQFSRVMGLWNVELSYIPIVELFKINK